MLRSNASRAIRHLRRRRGWRQKDLADASGISRQVISRLERGESIGGLRLRTIVRLTEALDASADLNVRWRGEELDRLMDLAHAAVVESCVTLLGSLGWLTRVEVSFNHYGDRGRVDVLGFHPGTRIAAVIEAKSAIGDAQETLGRLDLKTRLGPVVAQSVGWDQPAGVVPALVIGESRAARRLISGHEGLFQRFPLRGRQALAWLRQPAGPLPAGLLWFANVPDSRAAGITRAGRVRTVKQRC